MRSGLEEGFRLNRGLVEPVRVYAGQLSLGDGSFTIKHMFSNWLKTGQKKGADKRPAPPVAKPKPAPKRTKETAAPPPLPPAPESSAPTFDEKVIDALRPYKLEIVGLGLFVGAVLTELGLLGVTSSGFLQAWTSLCRQLTGWGAHALAGLFALFGLHVATRRLAEKRPYHITPGQVMGVELLLLTALPLSHLFMGASLPDAYAGLGGGLAGWALSIVLLDALGTLPTYLLYFVVGGWGLALVMRVRYGDVVAWLERLSGRFKRWAERLEGHPTAEPSPHPALGQPQRTAKTAEPSPPTPAGPPRRNPLLPPFELLERGERWTPSAAEIAHKKKTIEKTLHDFGVEATVVQHQVGPAITQFGVQPGHVVRSGPDGEFHKYKIRINQIVGLNKDLALALAAPRVRIEAPVPGKGFIGIEVPNSQVSAVRLGHMLDSAAFGSIKSNLGVAIGEDVTGAAVIADVSKLPHMLVAGQTGSGKSVFINAVVASLVFNNTPEQLKLVMIDPKKVELIRFNGLPHLMGKVEVEGERAIAVLRWLTAEMDDRYRMFAEVGARNLAAYNQTIAKHTDVKPLPYIVVLVDELADLMVQFGGDVEAALCRLAQMARATGIHLIVATQRPSTDVITGLIKANFPSRVSFAVASGIDSRVVLDSTGAENLLGRGDMLYLAADASTPVRVQGCLASDEEIDALVAHWRQVLPHVQPMRAPWESLLERQALDPEGKDDLLERAVALAEQYETISPALLQRRLRVGYPRAAKLIQRLYEQGLVEDEYEGGRTQRGLE